MSQDPLCDVLLTTDSLHDDYPCDDHVALWDVVVFQAHFLERVPVGCPWHGVHTPCHVVVTSGDQGIRTSLRVARAPPASR